MTAHFGCATHIRAPIDRVFDLALSIDAHEESMARFGERAVGGVTSGQVGLGDEVTWRARHFGKVWTMTSSIVDLERPSSFVDQQVRGPFARYRHEHRFESVEGDTRMSDTVFFDAPFGPVGDLAEGPLAHYLRRLIEHRNRYLREAAETSDLRLDDPRRGRPSPATSPAATGDGRRGSCRPSGRSGST